MSLSIADGYFSQKNSTNMMSGSMLIKSLYAVVEGFFWMLCSRTRLLPLRSSLHLSGSYLRH